MPYGTAYVNQVLGDASPRTRSPAAQRRKNGAEAVALDASSLSLRSVLEEPGRPLFYWAAARQPESVPRTDGVDVIGVDDLTTAGGSRASEDDVEAVWGVRSVEDQKSTSSIVGDDERTRVTPCTSQPYQWIVSLLMRFPNDQLYKGSGSIVLIGGGDARTRVVLTCAHNLYSVRNGGYAVEVTVTPAKDGASAPYGSYTVKPVDFKVAPEYLSSEDKRFDYAAIFLTAGPTNKFGFGYAALGDDELKGRIVETAGYSADKPDGTMWLSGGLVTAVDAVRFYYTNDTMGGASGSPVWTWATHNFVLVGIHGLGHTTFNSCRRLDKALIDRVITWSEEYK